ncbi:tetraacyldisaccharide 4'-kinase [Roseibium sp. RKSG952]|uniref:tetraacyldisaccharide 4'-kinase n=1 Tax=Roseibium sp. RKSG952 TaxID=2529384 RepID=UPI0012BCA102|nr:tetraacyldisaccharide 4'-kinase [Roseibium sp. RKSG952]MTI00593.1 tetraacyldisaccharide 4'-kinase [Roseibium sp. RKSG952]
MMKSAPSFWWKSTPGLWSRLLAPVGFVYGTITAWRMFQPHKARSKVPVICIGNFVVGGTGKTPFSIKLAELLIQHGKRPAFLLRGYGGTERGPLLVDPEKHHAGQVGDEALLLAGIAPTVISADRVQGAAQLEKRGPDIILMDDGFQNPSLFKTLSIVLVDRHVGTGNGRCVPAGPLRAPLSRQILKADSLVVVGSPYSDAGAVSGTIGLASKLGLRVFHAQLVPKSGPVLEGRYIAFAGIGRPQKFFATLEERGVDVVEQIAFPDHHAFSAKDAGHLITRSADTCARLITTSKDMMRLRGMTGDAFRKLLECTDVFEVEMEIDAPEHLLQLIDQAAADSKSAGQKV